MKNLLLLLFTLFTISLFGQLKYTAALGPNINLHKNGNENYFAPFSYFTNFGIKYPYKFVNLTGAIEWNISNWYVDNIDDNGFFTEFYVQTDYIKINPGIEVNLGKYFSLHTGLYTSVRMNEVLKSNFFFFGFTAPIVDNELNVTRLFDAGINYGFKIKCSKKIAITFNYIKGSTNILKKSFTNFNGGTTRNGVIKNRNSQLGVEFNLSEY